MEPQQVKTLPPLPAPLYFYALPAYMNFKKLLAQSITWRGLYFLSVLLVTVYVSRYMQAAGTGSLFFITIIFSFTQVALSLGMESGITYFASGNIIPRNQLTGIIAVWSIAAGALMFALLKVFFLVDDSVPDNQYLPYCIYGFCFISGMSLMNYTTVLFYTKEDYFLPNIIPSIINFLFVLFIPGKGTAQTATSIEWVTYAFFGVYLVQGIVIYLFYVLRNRSPKTISFPPVPVLKKFIGYSVTALAANVIFFLVYRVDYLFVKASPVCDNASLGNYIQVAKLGQMLLIVPQIIASVVFPKTAGGIEREHMNKSIMVIARLLSQVFLAFFLVVLVFGQYIFVTVFGESFNQMRVPMLLLIPGIFAVSVLSLLSAYFSGKGNLKVNVTGAILALVVMVVCDWIFVPHYGIIAAAAISTLSYCVNLSWSLWQFYKDYQVSWIEFLRWRKTDYTWLFSMMDKNKPRS